MLTKIWRPLSELTAYTFLQLDDMWQRGEIECRFEKLQDESGMTRGTIHHYRLPSV